jgi:DNA-binding transcriptional MerR regulator
MAIQLDTIEALRAKMKEAPEVSKEKRRVSKQEAIRELKRDIEVMQKRGYTLDDIAKFLTDGGMQITTPTLKSYLQRTKADKPKASKKAENFADAKTPVNAAQQPAQTAAVAKAKQVAEQKAQPTDAKGGFAVKPDSDI